MEPSDNYVTAATSNLSRASHAVSQGQHEKSHEQFAAAQVYALLAIASAVNRLNTTINQLKK
ncbi:MAG: hypothetical protein ACRDPY_16295 [Streptosporangiaceae bacterium]